MWGETHISDGVVAYQRSRTSNLGHSYTPAQNMGKGMQLKFCNRVHHELLTYR